MKKIAIIAIALLALVSGSFLVYKGSFSTPADPIGEKVVVYKTPDCGCCAVYAKYLERKGVQTEVIDVTDLVPIKREYGVPGELSSCHTSIVAGYVVEGHIPLEAIAKLLRERPNIRGIALPMMPPGTPGMPGPKTGDWEIRGITHEGEIFEFMTI